MYYSTQTDLIGGDMQLARLLSNNILNPRAVNDSYTSNGKNLYTLEQVIPNQEDDINIQSCTDIHTDIDIQHVQQDTQQNIKRDNLLQEVEELLEMKSKLIKKSASNKLSPNRKSLPINPLLAKPPALDIMNSALSSVTNQQDSLMEDIVNAGLKEIMSEPQEVVITVTLPDKIKKDTTQPPIQPQTNTQLQPTIQSSITNQQTLQSQTIQPSTDKQDSQLSDLTQTPQDIKSSKPSTENSNTCTIHSDKREDLIVENSKGSTSSSIGKNNCSDIVNSSISSINAASYETGLTENKYTVATIDDLGHDTMQYSSNPGVFEYGLLPSIAIFDNCRLGLFRTGSTETNNLRDSQLSSICVPDVLRDTYYVTDEYSLKAAILEADLTENALQLKDKITKTDILLSYCNHWNWLKCNHIVNSLDNRMYTSNPIRLLRDLQISYPEPISSYCGISPGKVPYYKAEQYCRSIFEGETIQSLCGQIYLDRMDKNDINKVSVAKYTELLTKTNSLVNSAYNFINQSTQEYLDTYGLSVWHFKLFSDVAYQYGINAYNDAKEKLKEVEKKVGKSCLPGLGAWDDINSLRDKFYKRPFNVGIQLSSIDSSSTTSSTAEELSSFINILKNLLVNNDYINIQPRGICRLTENQFNAIVMIVIDMYYELMSKTSCDITSYSGITADTFISYTNEIFKKGYSEILVNNNIQRVSDSSNSTQLNELTMQLLHKVDLFNDINFISTGLLKSKHIVPNDDNQSAGLRQDNSSTTGITDNLENMYRTGRNFGYNEAIKF